MIILATLSGIQDYLFDVQETGGGQARSLRARSLRIQLIAEVVALRLLEACDLSPDRILYTAAAKVAIDARGLTPQAGRKLRDEIASLERDVLHETHGRLRLAVAIEPADGTPLLEVLERAHRTLARRKLQTYRPADGQCWDEMTLIVPQVWRQSSEAERDAHFGRALVSGRWLVVRRDGEGRSGHRMLGVRVGVSASPPHDEASVLSVSNLIEPDQPPDGPLRRRFVARRFARHVPRTPDGTTVEFLDLAREARGKPYLAVLKADADHLGQAIAQVAHRSNGDGLGALQRLSHALNTFFGETLDREQRRGHARWRHLYTVFSGGDDMLMVGPWDIVLEFAGHVRSLFDQQFGKQAAERPSPVVLTISAGVAIIKPRHPIHMAAQQAEELLETAKRRPAPGASAGRDQCAALGQWWNWADHSTILNHGRQLAGWVEQGIVRRGWLHTLLTLSHLRRGEAGPEYAHVPPEAATARLAWHIERNWPRPSRMSGHGDPRAKARVWADTLLEHFDDSPDAAPPQVRYLPAILRYAMLATGSGSLEDA